MHLFLQGVEVALESRSIATGVHVSSLRRFVTQRKGQGAPSRERASCRRGRRGGESMGAFQALLEMLDVYLLLPAEAP